MRLVALITLAGPAAVWSQAPPDSAALAARVAAYVEPLVRSGELSGILLLAREKQVVFERGFGFADTGRRVAMTVSTPSAVASLSKPMTSVIATALVERGALRLTDPIARWLPDFPSADRITVEMLMGHRAGIRHRVTRPEDENVPRTAASMVPLISASPLLFEPGSQRVYSSMGYVVLARVLELATGRPYWQLLEEIVLRPARASHSADATHLGMLSGRAQPIRLGPDGPTPVPPKDLSFLVGAGSLYSTPRDLFRVFNALDAGAYGTLGRERQMGGRGQVLWTGITNGYRAVVQYDSASRVFLAFTANRFTGAWDLLLRDLPQIARGQAIAPPEIPKPATVAMRAEAIQKITGLYLVGPEQTSPVEFVSPRLAIFGDYLMVPTSDTTFFSIGDYVTVSVISGPDGGVTALAWGPGGPRFARHR